ncbi:hypothetical protein [Streptomyces canus]|uniref:hypothetical protein n=1 Tax=Streptomyces canus TaxID=58343 RepID=UPI002DD92C05|nr:hypothetical protein [Streptomyces canus]WSD92731.1 hypothetical protein OG925_51715 [Streptomyces canus]
MNETSTVNLDRERDLDLLNRDLDLLNRDLPERGAAETGAGATGTERGAAETDARVPGTERGAAETGAGVPGTERGAAEADARVPGTERNGVQPKPVPPGAAAGGPPLADVGEQGKGVDRIDTDARTNTDGLLPTSGDENFRPLRLPG